MTELKQALAALDGRTPPRGAVRVIALDGPSGAGKTTLARALAAELDAPVVCMDDLYPGWGGLAAGPGLLAAQVLEPLARGEQASYRRFDWLANRYAERVAVPPCSLLVVEGVGSTAFPAGDYAALRVWLDADEDVRRERGLARDGLAYAPHWDAWMRQERELLAAEGLVAAADIHLRTG